MGIGLLERISNIFGLVEEVEINEEQPARPLSRRELAVHSHAQLRFAIYRPTQFDDVQVYADCLRSKMAVVINFQGVPGDIRQRIIDFMDGVIFVTGGERQAVASEAVLYVPANVSVSKEFRSYTIPAYIKRGENTNRE